MTARDFKGVWVPKAVWLSADLTLTEKLFLSEIDSLDGERGCFAGNDHFAAWSGLSADRCKDIISSLAAKGYVTVTVTLHESNLSRRVIRGVRAKTPGGPGRTPGGPGKNAPQSNTKTSNTNTSTADADAVRQIVDAFVTLNPAAGKFYGNTTQRRACLDLAAAHGLGRVLAVVRDTLPKTNQIAYLPTVTTPLQLFEKWSALESGIHKLKAKQDSVKKITVI